MKARIVFNLIFLITSLFFSTFSFADSVVKVKGKKAILKGEDFSYKRGKTYLLYLQKTKRNKVYKKKALIKVLKLKNNKTYVKILKGKIYKGMKITKLKNYRSKSNNKSKSKIQKKQDKPSSSSKSFELVAGATFFKPGIIVDTDEDVGHEYSLALGAELGLRFKVFDSLKLRSSFSYSKGSADNPIIGSRETRSYDTTHVFYGLGLSYHFLGLFYLSADYGVAKMSMSYSSLGETLEVEDLYSGKAYKLGLGLEKSLSSRFNIMAEAGIMGTKWNTVDTSSSSSNTTSSVEFVQANTYLTLLIGIKF